MKYPHECQSIEELRLQIDRIDQDIIDLIGKRLSFIQEIVKYKNTVDEVIAKKRFQTVINERREMAIRHHLDPDVIENIYRIMMKYFIQEQLELLKKKQK